MRSPNTFLGSLCIGIILCTLSACGGSSPASRNNVRPPANSISRQFVTPACFWAGTSLGEEPGRIDFTVKCRSRGRPNRSGFSVGRYPLAGKSVRPGFRRIDHHPMVTGSGAIRPYGTCSRSGSLVDCSARSRGAVTVSGTIWVAPETRCEMGVSVTVAVIRRCEGHECYAQGAQKFLVTGRPEGCG